MVYKIIVYGMPNKIINSFATDPVISFLLPPIFLNVINFVLSSFASLDILKYIMLPVTVKNYIFLDFITNAQ